MAFTPDHYARGSIEPWDYIRDQGLNYHLGNAIKYISRAGKKDGATYCQDLQKAIHYLQNEISNVPTQQPSDRVSKSVPDPQLFEWSPDAEEFDRWRV